MNQTAVAKAVRQKNSITNVGYEQPREKDLYVDTSPNFEAYNQLAEITASRLSY